MASGTPIVCSDSTSLPEVVGDCALLFNPVDVQDISDSIIQIMTDDELSEKLVLGAQDRVGQFLENNVKNQYIKLWEELNVC
jgi:glycosyltransferase involved in cell wall biosynthesis